jgi:hypothetical protein
MGDWYRLGQGNHAGDATPTPSSSSGTKILQRILSLTLGKGYRSSNGGYIGDRLRQGNHTGDATPTPSQM